MSRTEKTQSESIEVNGLKIKKGALYTVLPKLDLSAPDGLINEGTTKIPSEGVSNLINCRYVQLDANSGIYDTGFYEASPCYRGLTDTEKKAKISILKKLIVKPYEENYSSGKASMTLDHTNLQFWDDFKIEIFDGRVFNTEDAKDFLELYIAIHSFDLTPVGMEGDPRFSNSDYVIKDADSAMSANKQRALDKMDAISIFGTLIRTEFNLAVDLLKALDVIRPNITPDEREAKIALNLWLDAKGAVLNASDFLEKAAMLETEEGKSEIILTARVKKLMRIGKIRKDGREYVYEGTPLGTDARSIVKTLTSEPELADLSDKIRMS